MLRNFHYEPDFDATLAGTNPTVQSSTPTWRTALRKMCDAWCEGLAAHRQYEHLRSRGIPHERASSRQPSFLWPSREFLMICSATPTVLAFRV